VDAPLDDGFEIVKHYLFGGHWPGYLLEPHNGHILFFPKLCYLLVAKLSRMDFKWVMLASTLLFNVAYVLLARRKNLSSPASPKPAPFLALCYPLACGAFLFNPMQFSNFLWAFQVDYAMALAFNVLSIFLFEAYALESRKTGGADDGAAGKPAGDPGDGGPDARLPQKPKAGNTPKACLFLVTAMLAGVVASFSSAQGMAIWPAVLVIWVMLERKGAIRNPLVYLWCLGALACACVFFSLSRGGASLLSGLAEGNVLIVPFFLTFLGNFARTWTVGLLVFLLSLGVLWDFWANNRARALLPALVVAHFLITAALVTLPRASMGVAQAEGSRYVAYSLLLAFGCVLYLLRGGKLPLGRLGPLGRLDPMHLAAFLILVVCASFGVGLHKSGTYLDAMERNRFYMATYDTQPDELLDNLYPDGHDMIRRVAAAFKERSLWVFSAGANPYDGFAGAPAAPTAAPAAADVAGPASGADTGDPAPKGVPIGSGQGYLALGDVRVEKGGGDPYLMLTGAALDPSTGNLADSVRVRIGNIDLRAFYGEPDPIARRLSKRKRHRRAGFSRAVPLSLLGEGSFPLTVVVIGGGKAHEVATGVTVTVGKGDVTIAKELRL
jgi:hypothetical protein